MHKKTKKAKYIRPTGPLVHVCWYSSVIIIQTQRYTNTIQHWTLRTVLIIFSRDLLDTPYRSLLTYLLQRSSSGEARKKRTNLSARRLGVILVRCVVCTMDLLAHIASS